MKVCRMLCATGFCLRLVVTLAESEGFAEEIWPWAWYWKLHQNEWRMLRVKCKWMCRRSFCRSKALPTLPPLFLPFSNRSRSFHSFRSFLSVLSVQRWVYLSRKRSFCRPIGRAHPCGTVSAPERFLQTHLCTRPDRTLPNHPSTRLNQPWLSQCFRDSDRNEVA